MSAPTPLHATRLVITQAGRGLTWQNFDDVFIVYQTSSAETHVFNETTALILRLVVGEARSIENLRHATEVALGLDEDQLAADDLALAVGRLEELGLIDCLDETITTQ